MSPAPRKSLGQHWLRDQAALRAVVDAADVKPGELVLEIGPGEGALTAELLARGARVHALELDEALMPGLQSRFERFSTSRFRVEQGDIRRYDFSRLAQPYKIVANIPYYLTANLLRRLTEINHKPKVAALLVQQEVAERVAPQPGQMAFISVAVQLTYEAELGRLVPAALFVPPPKVDSRILMLKQRRLPLFPGTDPKQYLRVAKAGFSQPRKTLLNNLSVGLGLSRLDTTNLIESACLSPSVRAQALGLQQWTNLVNAYQSFSLHHNT